MPINVIANPATLTWGNFIPSTIVIDPADGTNQLSYTNYLFKIQTVPTRIIDGRHAMAETFDITITPDAKIKWGTTRTDALLSHEQFHYDVGIVCARVLAVKLAALRAPGIPTLTFEFEEARELHMLTRPGIIQQHYDRDTSHGTNAHFQKVWKNAMTSCLANPKSTQILGLWL